jgi:hypothetical protein
MCWMCDHPGATRADYLDHVREKVAWIGWAIEHIHRDRVHPPWSYTVGMTMYGEPELVATGLSMHRASALLQGVAEHALDAYAPGQQFKLTDGPLIQVVEVAEPTTHLHVAVELFGPQVRALQVVHADDRGHWPWEVGYRGVQGGQPVLGTVPPSPTAQPAAPDVVRRPAERRKVVRTQPSRGSGSRRGTRGPQRRSARAPSRPPSTRR